MEKEVVTIDKTVAKIEEESNVWLKKAEAFEIKSHEDLVAANALAVDIIRHRKNNVEKELGPNKEAATKAWKAALTLWNKFVKPLEAAEAALKQKIITFNNEQERIRREREEKERREAEEAARVETERLQKEADDAAAAGRVEEFEEKAAAIEEVSVQDHMPVSQPIQTTPKGTSIKDKWEAEVVSLKDLVRAVAAGNAPLKCLKADEVYLGQRARSDKDALNIDGVRVTNKGSVSIRTK